MFGIRVAEPRAGWGAVVLAVAGFFLLGMRQSFTVPFSFGFSLAQCILLGGGILWVLTRLAGQRAPAKLPLLVGVLLVYLASSFLSYAQSMSRGLPDNAVTLADRYLTADLSLAAIVCFVLAVIRTRAALDLALKGLVLGGAVSAGFAIVAFGTGLDLARLFRLPGLKYTDVVLVENLMRAGISRPQGSAGHPLELSAVLTVLVPLAVGVAFYAQRRGARSWPWFLCTAVLAGGALVTVSRSAIVGLAAAAFVMMWRWPITRLAGIIVGIGGILGAGALFGNRIFSAFVETFAGSANDSSIASREIGADYVLSHYTERLWFGQGVGTYPALNQPVLDNQYLSRLMEAGVVGLVAFVALLVVALVLALRAGAERDPGAELASAIAGSLTALVVIALILDTAGFVQIWYLTWLLVAFSGVAWRLYRDAEPTAHDAEPDRSPQSATP